MTVRRTFVAAAGILILAACGPNGEDDPGSAAPDVGEYTTPPPVPPAAGGVTEVDSSEVILEQ